MWDLNWRNRIFPQDFTVTIAHRYQPTTKALGPVLWPCWYLEHAIECFEKVKIEEGSVLAYPGWKSQHLLTTIALLYI